MSQQSIIYGFIQGAEWMSSDFKKLHRLNRQVIEALPETDTFPFLTRGMFSVPGDEPHQGTFRSQIIHFGASMKEVEFEWRKFLEKFEALLRKLFWFKAVMNLHSEIAGEERYEWTVDANQIVHFFKDPPLPPVKWFFEGGPRDFEV